jgi:hypothetical protein
MQSKKYKTLPSSGYCFHASLNDFDMQDCHGFQHFGTRQAALERVCSVASARGWQYNSEISKNPELYMELPVYLYQVDLNITHALVIKDEYEAIHHCDALLSLLHYTMRGAITAEERDLVLKMQHHGGNYWNVLSDVLANHGWDSLAYANVHEDRGSMSWIVPKASQIMSIGKTEMTVAEAMVELGYTSSSPSP